MRSEGGDSKAAPPFVTCNGPPGGEEFAIVRLIPEADLLSLFNRRANPSLFRIVGRLDLVGRLDGRPSDMRQRPSDGARIRTGRCEEAPAMSRSHTSVSRIGAGTRYLRLGFGNIHDLIAAVFPRLKIRARGQGLVTALTHGRKNPE